MFEFYTGLTNCFLFYEGYLLDLIPVANVVHSKSFRQESLGLTVTIR